MVELAADTACALKPFWYGNSMGACNFRASVALSLGNMSLVPICDEFSEDGRARKKLQR